MQYLYDYGDNEETAQELRNGFLNYIEVHNFQDVLQRRIEYAFKLASAERDLLYEEMLKLFYLCDEIESLITLGLEVAQLEKNSLDQALKERFVKERKCARIIANHNCESWKSQWWWYKDFRKE